MNYIAGNNVTLVFRCIVYILLMVTGAQAQEPFMRHYGIPEGLAGSKVYRMISDKDGCLWFCTNSGISRFDGIEFRNYSLSNGFPDFSAYNVDQDKLGRLWFNTFDEQACFRGGHKFYRFQTPYEISWTCFDNKGDMYLLTQNGHVLRYKSDSLISDVTVNRAKIFSGAFTRDGCLLVSAVGDGVYEVRDKRVTKVSAHLSPVRLYQVRSGANYCTDADGIYEIAGLHTRKIYAVTKASMINSEILDLWEDNSGTMWISSVNGLFTFDVDRGPRLVSDKMVSCIRQDREGNYWFTTLNNGVYTFRYRIEHNNFTANEKGSNIIKVTGDPKGPSYAFYLEGNISKVTVVNDLPRFEPVARMNEGVLAKVKRDHMGGFMLQTNRNTYRFDGRQIKLDPDLSAGYEGIDGKLYKLNLNFDLMYYTSQGWKTDSGFGRSDLRPVIPFSRFYAFVPMKGVVWGGNFKGLFVLDDSSTRRPFPDTLTRVYVQDLALDRRGIIWVATVGAGVYYIKDGTIHLLTEADGFYGKKCNDLYVDDSDDVWVTATEGLFRIKKGADGRMQVQDLSSGALIPTGDVRSVFRQGNRVFVTSYAGLSYFDERKVSDSIIAPRVLITGISVNNVDTTPVDTLVLDHSRNNISVEYAAISFSWNRKPVYRYCLSGRDSVWKTTSQRSVNFLYLEPGTYTFYVVAENIDRKQSLPARVCIIIRPPFWRTWWFLLLVAGLAAIVIALVKRRYDDANRKERQYIENELKALRAQMNPHFIFNALNAIQDFVLHNDKAKANHYLVKFARLMRSMLENSRKSTVSLHDELNFLELYLDIEVLRFDNSFTYTIELDSNIDPLSYHIPSMILQPFVENAINHGLAARKENGLLSITLTRNDNEMKCTIEDNGVGRQRKQNETHSSTGILTTESRLKLLNQPGTRTIVITDLVDADGRPAGTRVEIWMNLPKRSDL